MADAYRRHPRLSALYVGTRFVAPLRAILAQDRRPRGARRARRDPAGRRFMRWAPAARRPVRLTGYQDSRPAFVGRGTLRAAARARGRPRPRRRTTRVCSTASIPARACGSRSISSARGSAELVFVDGWSEDETRGAGADRAPSRHPAPRPRPRWRRAFSRTRTLDDSRRRAPGEPPVRFLRRRHRAADPRRHAAAVDASAREPARSRRARERRRRDLLVRGQRPEERAHAVHARHDSRGGARAGGLRRAAGSDRRRRRSSCPQPGGRHEVALRARLRDASARRMASSRSSSRSAWFPTLPSSCGCCASRITARAAVRCRVVPYFEMMLAELPSDSLGKIEVRSAPELGALFFTNRENDFHAGHAFVATSLARRHAASACARASWAAAGAISRIRSSSSTAGPIRALPDDGIRIASFAGEVEVPAGGVEHRPHPARADARASRRRRR